MGLNRSSSWNFAKLPLVELSKESQTLQEAYCRLEESKRRQIARLQEIEEEINALLIDAYGLCGELSPETPEEQITLYRVTSDDSIKQLICDIVGCIFGRYSLDIPGVVYAHNGNIGDFHTSQYKTFHADDDGIMPVTDFEWFKDDLTNRFVEFLGTVWPETTLEANLQFVVYALGSKKGRAAYWRHPPIFEPNIL